MNEEHAMHPRMFAQVKQAAPPPNLFVLLKGYLMVRFMSILKMGKIALWMGKRKCVSWSLS